MTAMTTMTARPLATYGASAIRHTVIATLQNLKGQRMAFTLQQESRVPPYYIIRNGRLFASYGTWEFPEDRSRETLAEYHEVLPTRCTVIDDIPPAPEDTTTREPETEDAT